MTAAVGPRLGIAGGGQLARMTAQAALALGVDVVILEKDSEVPAATPARQTVTGDWSRLEDLRALARQVDVVTFENEFVDATLVAALEADGFVVRPSAHAMGIVQDKLEARRVLAAAGLPVPAFREATAVDDLQAAATAWGWPVMLKRRRGGYDGRGNATVEDAGQAAAAWEHLGGAPVYVEQYCPFVRELAVMVTRRPSGDLVTYPVAETVQRDHICHEVSVPAPVAVALATRATELAVAATAAVEATGTFGVELFQLADDRLMINELAPRVHNSGHYTIEGCVTSQFENHVRAVLDWPLGPADLRAPAAAMVNLLGAGAGGGRPAGLSEALAVAGAHVHLYGKRTSRPGRKMGHVSALGPTPAAALAVARKAAGHLVFGGSDGSEA